MSAIEVLVGDITQLYVSAIVNAGNTRLTGGGGVDGAIHAAAGADKLHEACAKLGGCPTGDVRLTRGFDLAAEAIIHAVGPVWQGGNRGEPAALRACYRKAMALAAQQGFESIAFSAISCGVYGYPHSLAVDIAVSEVMACFNGADQVQNIGSVKNVIFCCFNEEMAHLYLDRLEMINVGN